MCWRTPLRATAAAMAALLQPAPGRLTHLQESRMTCPAAALDQRSAAACAQLCASWAPLTGWALARGICMGARSGPMLGNPVVHKGLRPVIVPQGKLVTKEISLSCQTVKVCSPKCYLTPFLP